MSSGLMYIENIEKLIQDIKENQIDVIQLCAKKIAESLANNQRIHLFGTGHSHMFAEELFYRAGGLVNINPILEEGLMLHAGAMKSTYLERVEGYAKVIFNNHPLKKGDILIIASNSGRNAVTIEFASIAKEKGLFIIVLTSMKHTQSVGSRHKSGKLLYEFGDIVIDNKGCIGDASVELQGLDRKVAPTSTVIGTMILNAIVAETVEIMVGKGVTPEIYASSNIDNGEAINNQYINKYKGEIHSL